MSFVRFVAATVVTLVATLLVPVTVASPASADDTVRVGDQLHGNPPADAQWPAWLVFEDGACTIEALDPVESPSLIVTEDMEGKFLQFQWGVEDDTGFVDTVYDGCMGPVQPADLLDFDDTYVSASIGGTRAVGGILYADSSGGVNPSETSLSYAWWIGDQVVGTEPSYAPSLQDAGQAIWFTMTFHRDGYRDFTATSDPVTIAPSPGYTGELETGGWLTGVEDGVHQPGFGFFLDSDCQQAKWSFRGSASIVVPDYTVGTYVRYFLGNDIYGTCNGPVVEGLLPFVASPTVSIAGTPTVGETLSAGVADGDPSATSTGKSYQWSIAGDPVGGATQATFELPASAATKLVSVAVTSSMDGYVDDVTTATVGPVARATFSVEEPTITGTAQVGHELTCSAPEITGAVAYSWKRGATTLGSTDSYSPGAADVGSTVDCVVTVTRDGYDDAINSATSDEVAPGVFSIGVPTISGTATVGDELVCTAPDVDGAVGYEWLRGDTPLTSTASYTPQAEDLSSVLTCRVTMGRQGYEDAVNSADTAAVAPGTFEVGAPTISGTAQVGEDLTCLPARGTEGTPSYTWRRGSTEVGGSATYTPDAEDLGSALTCVLTVARDGYTDASNQAQSGTVAEGTFEILDPTISGAAVVGGTLTCTPPTGPWRSTVSWSDGTEIVRTGAVYLVGPDDVGSVLTCVVTATRDGYRDATSDADSSRVGPGTWSIAPPTIVGTAQVGQTVTCLHGDPAPAYAWTSGGERVGSAPAYVIRPSDLGRVLTCAVSAVRAGYGTATASAQAGPVTRGVFTVGAPTIEGTATYGGTLVCVAPEADGDVSYSWLRGGIVVASGPSHVLLPDDVGQALTCLVTVAREGYETATARADAGPVVAAPAGTYTAAITGTARVGSALRASISELPAGATVTWQWFRGAEPVAGATGARYEPVSDDRGRRLRAVASVVQPGHVTGTATAVSDVVQLHRLTLSIDPGSAAIGGTVTVTIGRLLPGEHWTLAFAMGRELASGVVGPRGGDIVRTVRLPRDLEFTGKRFVNVRGEESARAARATIRVHR